MHFDIIDHYFNIFFVQIQLKEKTSVLFGGQSFGAQTGILVSQMALIRHLVCVCVSIYVLYASVSKLS